MICPNCENKTSDQKLDCEHCGRTINKECPQCAEIVKIKANVCRYCGHEFKEKEPRKSPLVAVAAVSSKKNVIQKKSGKSAWLIVIAVITVVLLISGLLCVGGFQVIRGLWDSALVSIGLSPSEPSDGSQQNGSTPSDPSSGSNNPNPAEQSDSLVLIPLAMRSSGPGDTGWTFYDVLFTVENWSQSWLPITFDTGSGAVSTSEGFTYEGDPLHFSSFGPMLFGESLLLPPGFSLAGSTDLYNGFENTAVFQFMAANDSHPISIFFANYGMVSLDGLPVVDSLSSFLGDEVAAGRLLFPTDQPSSNFLNIGDTIRVADKANVTFANAYYSEYGIFQGVTIDLTLQNLNAGYENSLSEGCYMIDGLGFIRWNIAETNFYMGPGQTTQTTLGFYLWDPTAAFYGDTDVSQGMLNTLLMNAKVVCTGEFQEVLNLS